MGWFVDGALGHEGYVVGIVPAGYLPDFKRVRGGRFECLAPGCGARWQEELAARFHQESEHRPSHHWRELSGDEPERPVFFFQVACECGWRSPRMHAPMAARWTPSIVLLGSDLIEEAAAELWRRHANEMASEQLRRGTLLRRSG